MILAIIALVFAACDNPASNGGGTPTAYEDVEDISELDGIWKGSFSSSGDFADIAGGDEEDEEMLAGITYSQNTAITFEIDGDNEQSRNSSTTTMKLSGSNPMFEMIWEFFTTDYVGEDNVDINNSTHTITYTDNGTWEPITVEEAKQMGMKVNEAKTLMIIPAGAIDEDVPQLTLRKQ